MSVQNSVNLSLFKKSLVLPKTESNLSGWAFWSSLFTSRVFNGPEFSGRHDF